MAGVRIGPRQSCPRFGLFYIRRGRGCSRRCGGRVFGCGGQGRIGWPGRRLGWRRRNRGCRQPVRDARRGVQSRAPRGQAMQSNVVQPAVSSGRVVVSYLRGSDPRSGYDQARSDLDAVDRRGLQAGNLSRHRMPFVRRRSLRGHGRRHDGKLLRLAHSALVHGRGRKCPAKK